MQEQIHPERALAHKRLLRLRGGIGFLAFVSPGETTHGICSVILGFLAKMENIVPSNDHFLGIIAGLVTGYTIISYASHIFAGTQTLSVGITPLSLLL